MCDELLFKQIKRDEGFVPNAYQDTEGYWTIGYGRLIDVKKGGGISQAEAEYLLKADLKAIEQSLVSYLWYVRLTPSRKRAIANMAFNLGIGGLLKFKKMIAALERGDYVTAAIEALDSKWATQVGERAQRIAEMIQCDIDL